MDWQAAQEREVGGFLSTEIQELDSASASRLSELLVPLRQVPVARDPGQQVWVVAEFEGMILYWSDIEGGWELEVPNEAGGIEWRGASQFSLAHVMSRIMNAI